MIKMIKAIGMKSSDLNKLIREFPPGGETLVIRILVILCDSSKLDFFLCITSPAKYISLLLTRFP